MSISEKLIEWYNIGQRDLPWRHSKNPYRVWLSEIIMQQTRIAQGLSYFERFINKYPNITSLAKADEQDVLRLWQGLGYYSRARNLLVTAKTVQTHYNGVFPKSYDELKKLKGIGDYTAAAIASFCFDLPHAAVDGNVYRVLSRLKANPAPIHSTLGKKFFTNLAQDILDKKDPGTHNQAIMDLGALVCTPKNPDCTSCPVQSDCLGYKSGNATDFPVKEKRTAVQHRYFNYICFQSSGNFLIKKRESNDIWRNLYEFPMIETKRLLGEKGLTKHKEYHSLLSQCEIFAAKKKLDLTHILSHQKIHARLFEVQVNDFSFLPATIKGIKLSGKKDIRKYPIHRLMELFIEHISTQESENKMNHYF